MSRPRDGWTLAGAVDLARQGYQLDAIERRTRWAAAQVRANL